MHLPSFKNASFGPIDAKNLLYYVQLIADCKAKAFEKHEAFDALNVSALDKFSNADLIQAAIEVVYRSKYEFDGTLQGNGALSWQAYNDFMRKSGV